MGFMVNKVTIGHVLLPVLAPHSFTHHRRSIISASDSVCQGTKMFNKNSFEEAIPPDDDHEYGRNILRVVYKTT